jgi:hypothetical protein
MDTLRPYDRSSPQELPVVCSLEAGDLEERLANLVLSIAAPEAGQTTADALAAAFGGAQM